MFLFAVGVVGAVERPLGRPAAAVRALAGLPRRSRSLVRQARSLPTWFLHAFIWSHLAQMTVFLSHQYGFRLILPMYVAMVPIAAVGLALVVASRLAPCRGAAQAAPTGRRTAAAGDTRLTGACRRRRRRGRARRGRVAGSGSGSRGVLRAERRRRHGGPAGRAARTSLRRADATYFAGDDSRSTDVAYLNGLAFPTLRWFDGARGLVLPPAGEQALYVLPGPGRRRLRAALPRRRRVDRPRARSGERGRPGAADRGERRRRLRGSAQRRSGRRSASRSSRTPGCSALDGPASIEPGRAMDVLISWEALSRPRNRARPYVRLVDSQGRRWGQAESAVYPSSAWRPGERADRRRPVGGRPDAAARRVSPGRRLQRRLGPGAARRGRTVGQRRAADRSRAGRPPGQPIDAPRLRTACRSIGGWTPPSTAPGCSASTSTASRRGPASGCG